MPAVLPVLLEPPRARVSFEIEGKELVNCLGIAASMAAGVRENFGTDTRSLHIGKAAADGLLAACLAREGCTASSSALDGREGYLYEYSGLRFDPFGSDWYKTLGNRYDVCTPGFAIKQYPSCSSTTVQWMPLLIWRKYIIFNQRTSPPSGWN